MIQGECRDMKMRKKKQVGMPREAVPALGISGGTGNELSSGEKSKCSHEIKRRLLLGRKAMTNLDSILKSRDITLPTKFCLVTIVFPAVMYRCESWTIKKAERQRIDVFEPWCWRRLLRITWTPRRSNQFILKKISPEYLFGGLILKLKLQYFGHLMWRVNLLEMTLKLGRIEGRRRWGCQMLRWLDGCLRKLLEMVKDREALCASVHGVTKSQIGLSNWTTTTTQMY